MPVEVEFISALEAPPAVVWDRVVRVSGANDELWPFAKMTRPSVVDRLTAPGHGGLPPSRSWFLLFGVVPIDRRTMEFEVLEEGRFVESSTSWLNGRARHERTAIAGVGGSTVLTDRLVIESHRDRLRHFFSMTECNTGLNGRVPPRDDARCAPDRCTAPCSRW